ncbi:hypothetical protein B0H14DRAFT_2628698 [Mycena olivaceomarginata]|nr:hypothetical protein B0H14DRAFT_2628698 [Mycena olivaceomarginata]
MLPHALRVESVVEPLHVVVLHGIVAADLTRGSKMGRGQHVWGRWLLVRATSRNWPREGSRATAVIRGAHGDLRIKHGVARGIHPVTRAGIAENGPARTLAARGAARRCWGEPVLHALIGGVGVKPMGPGALTPRAVESGQASRARAAVWDYVGGVPKKLCPKPRKNSFAVSSCQRRTLSALSSLDPILHCLRGVNQMCRGPVGREGVLACACGPSDVERQRATVWAQIGIIRAPAAREEIATARAPSGARHSRSTPPNAFEGTYRVGVVRASTIQPHLHEKTQRRSRAGSEPPQESELHPGLLHIPGGRTHRLAGAVAVADDTGGRGRDEGGSQREECARALNTKDGGWIAAPHASQWADQRKGTRRSCTCKISWSGAVLQVQFPLPVNTWASLGAGDQLLLK